MKVASKNIIDQLISRYEVLRDCQNDIINAADLIVECYQNKHKLLICGNGGSAADAEHIVGELMKGFLIDRKMNQKDQSRLYKMHPETAEYFIENLQMSLPAISLVNQPSLQTAFSNDKAPELVFAQQVYGYGEIGDVLLCISTSGNSKNIIYAAQIAKLKDLKVIALTGCDGGELCLLSEVSMIVPCNETYIIQELHLPIYHALCACVENEFFT